MSRPQRDRKRERGLTLVEILIAFFVLFVVTLAILEMFTLALSVNMGSLARTELLYRAQKVGEAIRWIYSFENSNATLFATLQGQSGVNLQTQLTTTVTLPDEPADANFTFWGPGSATTPGMDAVDEPPPGRFSLAYSVAPGAGGMRYLITITAQPKSTGATRFMGSGIRGKAVTYVVQIP